MKKNKNQVSLAGVVKSKETHKTKKSGKAGWIVLLVLVVLIVGAIVGKNIYDKANAGPSLSAREMVGYTVTPDDISGKVSYFALGITGEKATNRMDMVAVMCLDRKADKVSILQMPVATYIDKNAGFATSALGDVWAKPQPVTYCPTCRVNLQAETVESGKHTACGTAVESRIGSSFNDLCRVFNDQYGLPIDNYLVIPRAGLAALIDGVGGVDIKLDATLSAGGVTYQPGVRTLSGAAATYYATQNGYNGTPAADKARMLRQRQVLTALLQRLSRYDVDDLFNPDNTSRGIISSLMNSANPVRFDTTSFGKSRLLGMSEGRADGIRFSKALSMFCEDISGLDLADITCAILPGQASMSGTSTLYSVNVAQTTKLLNDLFNPYGLTLNDTTVKIPTLRADGADVDTATVTLDTLAVEQTGDLNATATTTTPATTTTTAGG